LDSVEKILWIKFSPPENYLPNTKLIRRILWIYLFVTISMKSVTIWGMFSGLLREKTWFLVYLCFDLVLTVSIPLILPLISKMAKEEYSKLSKRYSDDQLRRFESIYAVTENHIILHELSYKDPSDKYSPETFDQMKQFCEFKDNFILLDHSKLKGVKITRLARYFVKFYFDRDPSIDFIASNRPRINLNVILELLRVQNEPEFWFKLNKSEFIAFLKAIRPIIKNVVIEFRTKNS
jgi:hypothetical protein